MGHDSSHGKRTRPNPTQGCRRDLQHARERHSACADDQRIALADYVRQGGIDMYGMVKMRKLIWRGSCPWNEPWWRRRGPPRSSTIPLLPDILRPRPAPIHHQIAAGNTKRTRARGILRGDFLALAASPKRDSTHAQFIQPRRGNDLLFLALRNIFISN
jgi:hypothetical protein